MEKTISKKSLYLLLFVSLVAIAGEVVVNGVTWQCQHACSVYTYPNGGTMVMDSAGGWVRRLPGMQ
jgi:hypothetical protein